MGLIIVKAYFNSKKFLGYTYFYTPNYETNETNINIKYKS